MTISTIEMITDTHIKLQHGQSEKWYIFPPSDLSYDHLEIRNTCGTVTKPKHFQNIVARSWYKVKMK